MYNISNLKFGMLQIRLAMESESMVEKGINFIFCLGTLSRFGWWDGHTSQNVFMSKFFALSSGTSTNPYFPLRRAFLLLYAIFIFHLSLHLLL